MIKIKPLVLRARKDHRYMVSVPAATMKRLKALKAATGHSLGDLVALLVDQAAVTNGHKRRK